MNGLNYEVTKIHSGEDQVQLDLIILFVLEGSMTVHSQGDKTPMQKGDILLISPGIAYSFHDVRDTLCGQAVYSARMISEIMEGKGFYLYANSSRDTMHSYHDIRSILQDLTAEYASHSHETSAAIDSLLLKLLDCLIEHYQIRKGEIEIDESENDVRLRQMMQYVVNHITDEINLTELADEMYVSTSTLSRIFKKSTGLYFSDYITKLRVQLSLGLLEYSDQNLTQIAMNCGFSNSNAFNRSFKKLIGMNPSEYRESKKEERQSREEEREKEEKDIRELLTEKGYRSRKEEPEQNIAINFDAAERKPYAKVWQKAINIGDLYLLTNANIQFHVLQLQEQLHYEYIRVWNVFSLKLQITDGRTAGLYNFDVMDQALDFLVQHHLKPFLDLGRRPDTALKRQGFAVYYEQEYIVFDSREKWHQMITAFLRHIAARYGMEEVSHWIFELTQDPDHQTREDQLYEDPAYDFFHAWQFLCQTIHSMIPGALAGGLSPVIARSWGELRSFCIRTKEEDCVPDFLSFLLFPYEESSTTIAGSSQRIPTRDSRFEEKQVSQMRRLLSETGLSDTKLFITEWNNNISNRNYLNDGCFRSAYLVQKTEELWGQTDLMGIMAGTDWVSSYFDTPDIIHGGIGLLTKNTICKPAFYAVEFLNQMGKNFIARGDHYIATMQDNGDIYLLLFHYSPCVRSADGQEDISLEESRRLVPENDQNLNLHLTLENVRNTGNFYVKRRILNRNSGSILDEWGRFQYQSNLTQEDIKYLRAICTPKILIDQTEVGKDHQMILDVSLEPEEVSLLHIFPVKM